MKKIMIGLGVLVIVVAGVLFYLNQNAPKIIRAVIEDQGSKVTQVTVDVANVELSISDLKAGIAGLIVGNPDGFKTDHALSLGEVSVKLSQDWTMDLIVVEEVMIRAPEVIYEIGSDGSNIDAIQRNVEKFTGAGTGSSSDSGDAEGPKVVINNLYIKGGKISVSAPFMGGETLATGLPDIHLKDIGKDSGGASPAEVANQIISAITKSASAAAGSIDLSSLGLSDISGKAAEVMDDASKKASEAVEGATDALNNLLGN